MVDPGGDGCYENKKKKEVQLDTVAEDGCENKNQKEVQVDTGAGDGCENIEAERIASGNLTLTLHRHKAPQAVARKRGTSKKGKSKKALRCRIICRCPQ
jgi:hypothetical protein